MEKLMALVTGVLKTVLPPAANLIRSTAGMMLTGIGELGKLILPKAKDGAKKLAKRRVTKKGRRLLRKTAAISGCVMVFSIAALVATRKK